MSFDFKNPTFLLSAAGVGLTAFALFAKSRSAASTSTSGGSGISSSDLTSQVNTVNSNAAAVTKALLGAQTSVEDATIGAQSSAGNAAIGAESSTGAQTAAGLVSVENNLVSAGSQYAMYDSGQRAGVITNTMQLGGNELSTIESAISGRYATAVAGSAAEYGTEVNGLTTQYGDSAAVMGAEIAQYPTEVQTVGTQTSSQTGSLAQQAAAESQAQASASNGFWGSLASIAGSASSAFTGYVSRPRASAAPSGYTGPDPTSESWGTYGSETSQAQPSYRLGANFVGGGSAPLGGSSSSGVPANMLPWRFNPPGQNVLSGGNPVRTAA